MRLSPIDFYRNSFDDMLLQTYHLFPFSKILSGVNGKSILIELLNYT